MNLYLRVLVVFWRALFGGRLFELTEVLRVRLRVYPNDLDSNLHMNNGRYLTVMDLGRFDFILRTGLWREVLKNKYAPVLAAAQIRYRMPLLPFRVFDLETRVVCWDDKWIYMEQRFLHAKGEKAGAVAAIALVKGGFYDPALKTTAPTQDILAAMGYARASPEFPVYIKDWLAAEESLRAVTA